MTLTDFLLARIAEDGGVARWAQSDAWSEAAGIHGFEDPWPSHLAFAEHITPARVLAECEAKRQLVEGLRGLVDYDRDKFIVGPGVEAVASETCRLLALPYADHPDYREEWKP